MEPTTKHNNTAASTAPVPRALPGEGDGHCERVPSASLSHRNTPPSPPSHHAGRVGNVLHAMAAARRPFAMTCKRPTLQPITPIEIHTVNHQGKTLGAEYAMADLIGSGSFGAVHLAHPRCPSLATRSSVILKTISRPATDRCELSVLQLIQQHDACVAHHLPRLIDHFTSPTTTTLVLVLEHYGGGDLFQLIEDRGYCSTPLAKRFSREILQALIWLHEHGIVHGDLKPENCVLDASGRVRVVDFGSARQLWRPDDTEMGENLGGTAAMGETGERRHTAKRLRRDASQTNGASTPVTYEDHGTPYYRSPERARGNPVHRATDLWSFGVTLFVMCNGYLPPQAPAECTLEANWRTTPDPDPDQATDQATDLEDARALVRLLVQQMPDARPTAHDAQKHAWCN